MRKIAIYGKGGIGKSTTSSNLTAALTKQGYRVMQIGCDPKADLTKNLMGGRRIATVLDQMKEKGDDMKLEDITFEGYGGCICTEAGGPTPGIGCAGRGIITAFEQLEQLHAYDYYKPDIVLYDVLGDVVCGGFAMPIRGGYADDVLVVTSGEMMSLYAASNISQAIRNFGRRGYARMAGLILNSRNVTNELELVEQAAKEMETQILKVLPRSETVWRAEEQGKTVIEAFPESAMAQEYMQLADIVREVCKIETV